MTESLHDEEKKKLLKKYTHDVFRNVLFVFMLFIMVLKNFNLQISV